MSSQLIITAESLLGLTVTKSD